MNGFVLTVFVILPACGAVLLLRRAFLLRFGVRVQAEIIGFETLDRGGSSEPESIRLPMVRFRTDTRQAVTLTLPSSSPYPGTPRVGDRLALVYPRGVPRRATYAHRLTLFLVPALCFVPAFVFGLFVAVSWTWHIMKN